MLTLFALNRSLTDPMPLIVRVEGFARIEAAEALQLQDTDLNAANTRDNPERVKPRPLAGVATAPGRLEATLAPASWNVIRVPVA
jgi:alpha-N-arabinofuranosidase